MNYFFSTLLMIGLFWQCTPSKTPSKPKNNEENNVQSDVKPMPIYDSIVLSDHGFKGYYQGPEFNEQGDIAHQFSNKAAKQIGNYLKEAYQNKTYLKIDFKHTKVITKGLDQEDSVYYLLEIPFQPAGPCSAHTGIEHCGSWNYQPKLFLDQRLKKQKQSLTNISVGKMECRFFTSNEGFQEYWIAFHHKDYQNGCK
ncbi:MAG: hypothetical protein ACKO8O_00710 [Betaproteobacteria bacterium]